MNINALNISPADIPQDQIPEALGRLEILKAALLARIADAASKKDNGSSPPTDRLLTAPEAAARLGVSPDWIYRRTDTLPFVTRLGRQVRFSSMGIEKYIRHREKA